jgi:hypothetical protein
VGGSAREWSSILPADSVPGDAIDLRLVMTKFGGEAVEVGWKLRVE